MRPVKPPRYTPAALALGLAAGALLGGCGSATKTVTVAATPSATQATETRPQATETTPSATSAAPPANTSAGGTPAPTSTRTAPEPAFTEGAPSSEGTAGGGGVAAAVRARGYTPNDPGQYHPGQTLGVLVGTRAGSGDGYGQRAFFFVNGRYLGTDTKEPSASVKVVSQGDTEVTLAYPLYRSGDALCCPGGGQATVHFQLNNGRLTPLDPIPPAHSTSALSRY